MEREREDQTDCSDGDEADDARAALEWVDGVAWRLTSLFVEEWSLCFRHGVRRVER